MGFILTFLSLIKNFLFRNNISGINPLKNLVIFFAVKGGGGRQ